MLCIIAGRSIIQANENERFGLLEEKTAKTDKGDNDGLRTFRDDYFDLTVQVDAHRHVTAFELGYHKEQERLAMHWDEGQGLRFSRRRNDKDISDSDGEHGFNVVVVEQEFERRSHTMDLGIASFIIEMLRAYRAGESAESADPSG